MAQQEEGWPLGLNLRANRDLNGSLSFNTLLTGSPVSSSESSSDLDSESTGSFFHDKSITLGSLIGISSILEISRRSTRGRRAAEPVRNKKNYKTKAWFLSLCSRLSTDAVSINDAPSLGHFLEAERRAATSYRRNATPDDYAQGLDTNSLFTGDQVAPSQSGQESNVERALSRDLLIHENGDEPPLILSCLCGHLTQ